MPGAFTGMGWAEGRNVSIEFCWGTGGGAQMPAFASELIELRSRCQRSTLSSTISARNLPCSAVMRPTVMGRRKRRGPALPGLKKSVPFFVSILGWCGRRLRPVGRRRPDSEP
jgi:hypothetical protein